MSVRLTFVAVCLLFTSGSQVAAQAVGAKAAINLGVFAVPDDEAGADAAQPSPELPIPKAPAPAELPPSSPMVTIHSSASVAFGREWAGRNAYRELVDRESRAFDLPPALVDAIMAVESRYNSNSVGRDGEVGLMQVMLPTARMLGFTGSPAELAAPEINVHYGTKYLAGAWRLARGDLCTAAMKYRAGHGETRFSFLSVDYCLRVRNHLAAGGVAISGPVPAATFGRTSGAPPRGRSISGVGALDLVALNARLRGLTNRRAPNASD